MGKVWDGALVDGRRDEFAELGVYTFFTGRDLKRLRESFEGVGVAASLEIDSDQGAFVTVLSQTIIVQYNPRDGSISQRAPTHDTPPTSITTRHHALINRKLLRQIHAYIIRNPSRSCCYPVLRNKGDTEGHALVNNVT